MKKQISFLLLAILLLLLLSGCIKNDCQKVGKIHGEEQITRSDQEYVESKVVDIDIQDDSKIQKVIMIL